MNQSPSRPAWMQPEGIAYPSPILRGFAEIIPLLLEGKTFARQEWQATEPESKVYMKAGVLHILRDGVEHRLIVSDGDLAGTDWIMV